MGRSSVRATKSAKRCQASLMGWCPVKIPVSMATSRATLSGCSTAMRRPIGPPQSCSTRVTSRRSRSSSSEAITSVCRSKEYHDSEIGLSERPNPTRSGATQRKPASRTGGITLRHRNDQVGSPCRNTTGAPSPSSTCARRSPPTSRYLAGRSNSGSPSKRSSGVRYASVIDPSQPIAIPRSERGIPSDLRIIYPRPTRSAASRLSGSRMPGSQRSLRSAGASAPVRSSSTPHEWNAFLGGAGGLLGGLAAGGRLIRGERQVEHLPDLVRQVEGHLVAHRLWHVVEVAAVAARQDDLLEAGPVGG